MNKIEWIKEYVESMGAMTADSVPANYKRINLFHGPSPDAIVRRIGGRFRFRNGEQPSLEGKIYTVRMIGDEYLVGEYVSPDTPLMEQLDPHLRKLINWFSQNIDSATKTKRFLRRISFAKNYFFSIEAMRIVQEELGISAKDWDFTATEYFTALANCLFIRTKNNAGLVDSKRPAMSPGDFTELILLVECAKADGFQVDSFAQGLYDRLAKYGRFEDEDERKRNYANMSRLCGPDAPDDVVSVCRDVVYTWAESAGVTVVDTLPDDCIVCSIVHNPTSPALLVGLGFRYDGACLLVQGDGAKLCTYRNTKRSATGQSASSRGDEEVPESLAERVAAARVVEKAALKRLVTSENMVALAAIKLQDFNRRDLCGAFEDLCNCMEATTLPCGPTPFAVLDYICRNNQFDQTDDTYSGRRLLRMETDGVVSFTEEEKQCIEALEIERDAWRQKTINNREQ